MNQIEAAVLTGLGRAVPLLIHPRGSSTSPLGFLPLLTNEFIIFPESERERERGGREGGREEWGGGETDGDGDGDGEGVAFRAE